MKITVVHVDTLELAMEEPFVTASSVCRETHDDGGRPQRPHGERYR